MTPGAVSGATSSTSSSPAYPCPSVSATSGDFRTWPLRMAAELSYSPTSSFSWSWVSFYFVFIVTRKLNHQMISTNQNSAKQFLKKKYFDFRIAVFVGENLGTISISLHLVSRLTRLDSVAAIRSHKQQLIFLLVW